MSVQTLTSPSTLRAVNAASRARRLPPTDSDGGAQAYEQAIGQLGILSVTDIEGRILHVNDEFVRVTGYAREDVIGLTHKFLNSGQHPKTLFKDMHATISAGKMWRSVIKNRAKNGSLYWVDASIVPLKHLDGSVSGYLCLQVEITENVNLHIELQARNALLQGVVESFPGGIQVFDSELRPAVWNRKLKDLVNSVPADTAAGAETLENIIRRSAQSISYDAGPIDGLVVEGLDRASKLEPHVFEGHGPGGRHIEVRSMPLYSGGFVTTYFDITDRKNSEEMVAQLARHDPLTGLPNRKMFQERIREAVARIKRGESFALLCIDLDRFKPVNDTLGHPVGDELLKAVALRLKNCVRETDTVARLGGDEFAIILTAVKKSRDVQVAATRVVAAMRMPFRIKDNTIEIGASVGIAVAPQDGETEAQLMQHADLALYRAKSDGRGRFEFFQQDIQKQLQARNELVTGLQVALTNKEFEVYYQPIVNIASRTVSGCEALIRWKHPTRGFISAAEFIPIAEEAGLIGKIGEWALQSACREAAGWPGQKTISVNVSAAQLRDFTFVDKVQHSLGNLDPKRLILEITETIFIQDKQMAAGIMQRLKDIGVRLALDDFGTGFSSLSYLQLFPFDKIKIDRSFVSNTADPRRAAALRRAIIHLANDLGMSVTAEGVETREQLAEIIRDGCREAQGYLFSKPINASSARAYLEQSLEF